MNFSFSKKKRLFKLKDFIFLSYYSKKYIFPEIDFYISNNNLKFPRIGISISKKYIKLAHERNKIKRIIRENFRLNQKKINCFDFLIKIKKSIKHNKTKKYFRKIMDIINDL